jgi:hypothetical protein
MTTTSPNVAAAQADVKHNAERLKADGSALVDDLKGQAEEYGEVRKDQFADRVGGIADTLRSTSKKFRKQDEGAAAGLTDTAADQLDRVSASLRNKDLSTMMSEASDLARSHPAIFLGGAVALGFVAGRFLRASSEEVQDDHQDMPATPGV